MGPPAPAYGPPRDVDPHWPAQLVRPRQRLSPGVRSLTAAGATLLPGAIAAARAAHHPNTLSLTVMDRTTLFGCLAALLVSWMPNGLIHNGMQAVNPAAPAPLSMLAR